MVTPAVTINHLDRNPMAARSTEFVERKGLGHPDSICDGIADAISRRLSSYYRDEFGAILHHNTDKVQLVAGHTEPAFGGGELVDPIYVLIGGRATKSYDGTRIPVDDLAVQAARDYVADRFEHLPRDGIEFDARIGETSPDLQTLFDSAGVPRANDTSVGVGYAPLSETDRIVRDLGAELRSRIPAVGDDVKVMGWRGPDHLQLTVAAAIVSRLVDDLTAYLEVIERVEVVATAFASERTDRAVSVDVNAADDPDAGSVYLTETGLSAEMGDDGNVGRGNRTNGVITPHRPMSLEAAAGKNPVSHVGKLYNLVARNAAERIHRGMGAAFAEVKLLSQIGQPITDPLAIDVDTTSADDAEIERIVLEELDEIESLTPTVVAGDVQVF